MSSIFSFGDWVRLRRKSLDLTQAGLASRVGCALVTLKKIEQDERKPSRLMAERLANCLGIPDHDRSAFIQAAQSQLSPDRLSLPAAETPSSRTFTRLPQPATPLIGRRKEISKAVWLLRHHTRLLTLTGVGGVGKTRLALAVAHQIVREFRNGAVYISLAPIQDPELVLAKIAQEMSLKENSDQSIREMLCSYFSDQEILLILDNFEHLLPSAPLLADLLLAAPKLHLLVTSQSILHLSSETILTIQPLDLPDASVPLTSDQNFRKIARSNAVRLFVNRAKARYPTFRLSKENSQQVADICRRLDGLPLAIELAAARVREYPLPLLQEGLVQRLKLLDDGFHDLPARQQTLRSTFDWSFNHLNPAEQEVFPRLGVFQGGFTLEAVLAVCSSYSMNDLLAAIGGLTDKSMISRTEDGNRYDLLETAHEYALDQLETRGQIWQVRRAHLAYFAQMVEEAAPHLWDKEQEFWLQWLTMEIENLRGALRWSLNREIAEAQEVDLGARMAASLWYFWYIIGALKEGQGWLAAALDGIPQLNQTRARLLMADGALAWQQGKLLEAGRYLHDSLDLFYVLEDQPGLAEAIHIYGHIIFDQQNFPEAEKIFRESLSMYESLGDRAIRISLIGDLGLVAYHRGDLISAKGYYEQCLALSIQEGVRDGEAQTYIRLGDVARLEGDYEKADELYEKSLLINRELKITLEIACSLHKLGFTKLHQGQIHLARSLFCESLALQYEFNNQQGIAECLAGLASVGVFEQEFENAVRYFGAARQILAHTRVPMSPSDFAEWQRDELVARSKCGPERFEKAFLKGKGETIEDLVASFLATTSTQK